MHRSLARFALLVLVLVTVALTAWSGLEKAPLPGDLELARRTQSVDGLGTLATAVNWAGDLRWAPAVLFFAWWAWRDRRNGRWRGPALLGFALLLFQGGSQVLKEVVDSPRPAAEHGLAIDRLRRSAGFPSGHVYGDVLTYGALATFAPRALPPRAAVALRVLAFAVVLPAGWARLYVGAHWPSDVLGGYLWGALALAAVVALGGRGSHSRRDDADARMTPDTPRAVDGFIDRASEVAKKPAPPVEEREG